MWKNCTELFDDSRLLSSLKFLDSNAPQFAKVSESDTKEKEREKDGEGLESVFSLPELGPDFHLVWELEDKLAQVRLLK